MRAFKWIKLMALVGVLMLTAGCDDSKTVYVTPPDTTPPSVPRGVSSVTGDQEVTILWFADNDLDLAGYVVYRSNLPDRDYVEIAQVAAKSGNDGDYVDGGVTNGRTYYYAVTAFDETGNESGLSYEDVFDTPRPAGYNVLLDSDFPDLAGFDFSRGSRVPLGDSRADIEVLYKSSVGTLTARVADLETDIQDFGFTDNLDAVDWAPADGWSNVGWVELIKGHSYVVWTRNDHYAKFRVSDMGGSSVLIDWAYQIDVSNPELKRAVDSTITRGGH